MWKSSVARSEFEPVALRLASQTSTSHIPSSGKGPIRKLNWIASVFIAASGLLAEDLPRTTAERVGLSSERLEGITPLMEDYVRSGAFPGMTVAVVRQGQIAYLRSFGHADIDSGKNVQSDTIFRIYSMSKPVTAVAALMLYEEGRFSLDDPVSRYLPAFRDVQVYQAAPNAAAEGPPIREMTIRDLFRHTSGLGYGWENDPVSEIYRKLNLSDPHKTLEEISDQLASAPLFFPPGQRWQYSLSIDLLGRLIEVLTGNTLEEYFSQRIFGPLRMVDTGFFVPPEKLERLTSLYRLSTEGKLEQIPEQEALGRYDRTRNKLHSGGGGLVSTASDYLRFAQMLANGGVLDSVRILGPRTVALMGTNHLPPGIALPWDKLRGHGYGLGVSVLTDLAQSPGMGTPGDWGWDGAASTFFRIDPSERLVILLMTHRMPCDTEIQVRLKTLVYQAIEN